jgi:hypothetical protein
MTQRYGNVERAVRRDLRRLPVDDRSGALAASALTLARLLDQSGDVDPDKRLAPAAQAARELRSTMTELMKNAPKARSGIDELRSRRAARAASG